MGKIYQFVDFIFACARNAIFLRCLIFDAIRNLLNMKLRFAKIALFIAAIGAVACSSDIDSIIDEQPVVGDVAQPGEVRIAVPEGTRSSIVTDGDLRWDSSDEISILAYDSNDNSIAMSPTQFKFVGSKENGNGSYFTAIPTLNMSADGTYDYYAISPSLDAANELLNRPTLDGSTLSFTIPQTQDGQFRADMDLMIAKATSTALEVCTVPEYEYYEDGTIKEVRTNEPINNIGLMFYHRTHMLRFTIPSGATNNLGKDIKKVHLLFPKAVVGTLKVDIKSDVVYDSNGITSPVPVYSNTNNKITVEFASPKRAGDDFWVMTFPYDSGMENVDIRFEDVDGNVSQRRQVTFANMAANSVTPVTVQTIPAAAGVTSFSYTVGTNNLGEDLTSMNITLPAGCYFTNFEQTSKAVATDGKHTFSVFNDMLSAVENKTLPFELESEHALFSQTVSIRDLADGQANDLEAIDVPYLFAEDFSGIPTFSDGHDNPTVGWYSDQNYREIKNLSSYTNSLKGWYGTRIGGSSGNSVRICCRYENITIGVGSSAYYKGRIYTPFLSNIKDDKRPTVEVSFNYATVRDEMSKSVYVGPWPWDYDDVYPEAKPKLYFGVNSQETVTNPDKSDGDIIDDVTGLLAGTGFASPKVSSLSPIGIDGEELAISNGSYTSLPKSKTVVNITVDSNSRLAWIVSCNNDWTNVNANYWLYLDNITVKIKN